jgi:hypothetical protein
MYILQERGELHLESEDPMLRDFWVRALRPLKYKDSKGESKSASKGGTRTPLRGSVNHSKQPAIGVGLMKQFNDAKRDGDLTPARRAEIEELEHRNARLEGSVQDSYNVIREYTPRPPYPTSLHIHTHTHTHTHTHRHTHKHHRAIS